jgi:hypothetical protein
MKRFLLIILVTAVIPSYAQQWSPGFIVTTQKDSLKGFILDLTDAEVGLGITFKRSLSENGTEYPAINLLRFGFDNGRVFRRFSFPKDAQGDSAIVFAKKNIVGKINLYSYSKLDENHPDIFLVNNYSHRTVRLTPPKKIVMTDATGRQFSGESSQYVGLIHVIKDSSTNSPAGQKKLRYSLKAIQKDILDYNMAFKSEFPITEYNPPVNHSYRISAGIPISKQHDVDFRAAIYTTKSFPEDSRTFSILRGISYRYSNAKSSDQITTDEFLSVIPLGVNFETKSKFIRPYIYGGIGLAFLLETNHHLVNNQDVGVDHLFSVFPTFNVGAGLKIKLGPGFMMLELTPGVNGLFANFGYSF